MPARVARPARKIFHKPLDLWSLARARTDYTDCCIKYCFSRQNALKQIIPACGIILNQCFRLVNHWFRLVNRWFGIVNQWFSIKFSREYNPKQYFTIVSRAGTKNTPHFSQLKPYITQQSV